MKEIHKFLTDGIVPLTKAASWSRQCIKCCGRDVGAGREEKRSQKREQEEGREESMSEECFGSSFGQLDGWRCLCWVCVACFHRQIEKRLL
jgi:hypothetical protein